MPRIKDDYAAMMAAKKPQEAISAPIIQKPISRKASNGIVVEGIDNCLIKLSRCCSPLPGDQIIGFITRGHGVSIHKRDCNNVPKDIKQCEYPERWVNAYFEKEVSTSFRATLVISGNDRTGFLADITLFFANNGVPMHNVNARQVSGGRAVVSVTISVQSADQISAITGKLKRIDGVFSVERMHG